MSWYLMFMLGFEYKGDLYWMVKLVDYIDI